MKTYELKDVAAPNLLEGIFPYSLPPLITFDGKIHELIDGTVVEFDPNEVKTRDIHITDTTFRDGQQASAPVYKRADGEAL